MSVLCAVVQFYCRFTAAAAAAAGEDLVRRETKSKSRAVLARNTDARMLG